MWTTYILEINGTADDVNVLDVDAPWCATELPDWNLKLDLSDGSAVGFNRKTEMTQRIFLQRQILELNFA